MVLEVQIITPPNVKPPIGQKSRTLPTPYFRKVFAVQVRFLKEFENAKHFYVAYLIFLVHYFRIINIKSAILNVKVQKLKPKRQTTHHLETLNRIAIPALVTLSRQII